ncbi:ABC transporter ATP-binding protein [Marinobacterium sp. YM272]|uniref:ABC transporter ATP-binding protein n=1 Tax=Marinobacterium sp. YM272 TaxID=3421654 RepID=UPI003D7F5C07
MAFAEIASVIAIGPFMALVGDLDQLRGEGLIAQFYVYSGAADPHSFLMMIGAGVLTVLTLASAISIFTAWCLALYGTKVGAELSCRLFRHYLYQPWLFHTSQTSSQLTNRIALESQRVTNSVINPLMQLNAKLVLAFCMAVAIFIYNPLVALGGVSIFIAAYLVLYLTVRRRLIRNGRTISDVQGVRFKLMNEGFGGIRDVLLLERQPIFTARFERASNHLARAQGTTRAMGQIPRYIMELVAFGSIILLVLYLLAAYDGNLGAILPMLSIYALAGFKLLPALQVVYGSTSQIRGNLAAIDALRTDLQASALVPQLPTETDRMNDGSPWKPKQRIQLKDVTFTYPGKTQPVLKDVTLDIDVNQTIGLVGPSGGGKSTIIDILLGLIKPQQGQLLIDGEPVTEANRHLWHRVVGFVPQSIFLADSSIRENIAFGLPQEQIDDANVTRAAHLAHLDELLESLPDGLETRVGERGIQLSGGQRQRIGIARALYYDPDILVLDEATSALDGATEKAVMDAIYDFSGKKTIVMIAHRLTTVEKCDLIYSVDGGLVFEDKEILRK